MLSSQCQITFPLPLVSLFFLSLAMMSRRKRKFTGMIGVPSSVCLYWKTPPEGSSTTKRRSVMRTGLFSFSTGTSHGSVGHGGVGLGCGAGVGVATGAGVGVATGAGATGVPPPPPPQEARTISPATIVNGCFVFIGVFSVRTALLLEGQGERGGSRAV